MAVAQSIQVQMKKFIELSTLVSPDITVCVRGRHAIGKSEGVVQIAQKLRSDFYKNPENCKKMVEALHKTNHIIASQLKATGGVWTYEMGVPVIMRRLSQLTEGDVTGLPEMTRRGTQFRPCDWLLDACEFPCVLFLDERNRALDGVKQAVFELCDSKGFYGYRLHEETRVIIAENVGDQYNVQANDPAEISRCLTVELDPSVDEWIDYCISQDIHPYVTDFIRANKKSLEHDKDQPFEANKKYADRRSWFKLGREAEKAGLFEDATNPIFYTLCGSMLGVEVGRQFAQYCQDINKNISAMDIIHGWDQAKKRLGRNTAERYLELSKKLCDLLKTYKLRPEEGEQVGKFMHDAPAEARVLVWTALNGDLKNMFAVHKFVHELMVKTAAGQETRLDEEDDVPASVKAMNPPKMKK